MWKPLKALRCTGKRQRSSLGFLSLMGLLLFSDGHIGLRHSREILPKASLISTVVKGLKSLLELEEA